MKAGDREGWYGAGQLRDRRFTWNLLLWSLIHPRRQHRIRPTVSGLLLVSLALAIGTAAYNSSSNILFITLSLLLACLILSGVLSWLNLRGVSWRLRLARPLRAGQDTVVSVGLRNGKKFLPTYGLAFDLTARPMTDPSEQRAESTVTGRGLNLRAMLARAEAGEARGRLVLRGRLDAGEETRLEWVFRPAQRGRLRVQLAGFGSLFPFGFMRKTVSTEAAGETVVWPAPVEYRRLAVTSARRPAGGERVSRPGSGGDLLALRRYSHGDSHRLIHWKASARSRTMLVRQFAAESAEGYTVWLRTDGTVWTRPEQFELLVSFCATLVEDLFRSNRLTGLALDDERPKAARGRHDLELFLDQLATVRPRAGGTSRGESATGRKNLMTFAPDGLRGVAAYIDGQKAAAT